MSQKNSNVAPEGDSIDMWNKDYQIDRIETSKKWSSGELGCCGKIILKCFKNLIYVFVIVILCSFSGMIYLISRNNDDQLGITGWNGLHSTAGSGLDFRNLMMMLSGEEDVKINTSVQLGLKRYIKGQLKRHGDWFIHPVFETLQKQSPMGYKNYLMREYDMQNNQLSKMKFYQDHVSQSIPAILRGDCLEWDMKKDLDAVNLNGTQDEYLIRRFSQSGSVKQNAKIWLTEMVKSKEKQIFKQGKGQGRIVNTGYSNFTDQRQHAHSQTLYYIQDLLLSPYNKMQSVFNSQFKAPAAKGNLNDILARDHKSPSLLNSILRQRNKLFTQWTDFDRKPVRTEYEQQICVLKGHEEFVLVSPIWRQNIYVGALEQLDPIETPIDFFQPDVKLYPFSQNVAFMKVKLRAGDCLYVPAYFYVQSRTLGSKNDYGDKKVMQKMTKLRYGEEESIIFTHQYAAHSQIVDMVLSALEDQVIIDDKAHQWDSKIVNYLKNLY